MLGWVQGLKYPWSKRPAGLHEERETSAYVSECGQASSAFLSPSLSRRYRGSVEAAGAAGGEGGGGDEKHLLRTSVNTRCSVYFRTTSPVSYYIRIADLFIVTSRELLRSALPTVAMSAMTRWRHLPTGRSRARYFQWRENVDIAKLPFIVNWVKIMYVCIYVCTSIYMPRNNLV